MVELGCQTIADFEEYLTREVVELCFYGTFTFWSLQRDVIMKLLHGHRAQARDGLSEFVCDKFGIDLKTSSSYLFAPSCNFGIGLVFTLIF